MKVAVLGAGGFIGSTIVETFLTSGIAQVVPVVRRAASVAAFSQFNLTAVVADANNQAEVAQAIKGCGAVIHCVWGPPATNVNSAMATLLACQDANVRRMIYLSTIAVHGYAPEAGTNDKSPLLENQPFGYGASKARAERHLSQAAVTLPVEMVVLRPGPVYGPRSSLWTTGIVDEILSGKACLVEDGRGICNCIYIGNLIEAIRLCLFADRLDIAEQAFIVGDRETITWKQFYGAYAQMLGSNPDDIPSIPAPAFAKSLAERVGEIPVDKVLPLIPSRIRQSAEAALARWKESDQMETADEPDFAISRELAACQQAKAKLPYTRASTFFGYEPLYSFEESMKNTAAWLSEVGYPIRKRS